MSASKQRMSQDDPRRIPKTGRFPAVRHKQLSILLPGLFLAYSCRINLSVAIVSMTDTSSNSSFPTVNWDTLDKGTLLGTFFYGYTVGGPPSGFLVNKVSPSKTLGSAALLCGIFNALFPWVALYLGYTACCIARVLQGLCQACFFPGVLALISKWAIPKEKGWINSFVCSGVSLGSAVTLAVGGLLEAGPTGWPSIFYVTGGALAVWGVLCFIFLFDTPSAHKTISDDEKIFIESQMTTSETEKVVIPWSKILLSIPVWACTIACLAFNWGYWTLSTLVPTYLKSTLQFDTAQNGFLSALPNFGMFICCLAFPFVDKLMAQHFNPSLAFRRKFWSSVCKPNMIQLYHTRDTKSPGLYIPAIAMLVLASSHVNAPATVALLVIAVAMNAGLYQGFQANPLDLTTKFAGLVGGICNGTSSVAAIVAPTVAGLLIHDETNFADWQIVFLLAAVINVVGNTIFLIFGSGEVQSWDHLTESKGQNEMGL